MASRNYIPRKNFRTAPYFIMHAHLINYAFYSLSLNTIDNSLGNWIYTFLIITYCINKSSPLSLPHFSGGYFLLSILSPRPLSVYFFFFFTLPVGFELSIFYLLHQTSSLSSIPLLTCLLPVKGNFQNYISNTLFKFQKLTLKSFPSPLKHVGFFTKKWNVNLCLIEV